MPVVPPKTLATSEELRARALLILDAFEQEESSPTWRQMRDLVQSATRVRDLRTIVAELRGAMSGLTPVARQALNSRLAAQFGADEDYAGQVVLVAKVIKRGRILSEAEYLVVQAIADSIAGHPGRGDEFLALGSLLDAYSAAP